MSKRRKAGEGSIFRRADGLWVGSISIGPRTKRIRRTIYGRTPVEVRDELTRLKSGLLTGRELINRLERQTVAAYLASWLETPDRWRPATRRLYKNLLDGHVIPLIGHLQLNRLRDVDVLEMRNRIGATGGSASLRRMCLNILSNALSGALRLQLIQRNVCDAIERPRVPLPEINTMTGEQVVAFLKAARADRLYAFYLLALTTGMREGELFALRWRDVDLDAGTLSVCHTLTIDLQGKTTLTATKTPKSRRRIELGPTSVRALREHQARMFSEGKRAAEQVFCDTNGHPLRKDNVRNRSFNSILRKAGLPHFRIHDLRHTFATRALEQGVHPKVVAEMLGHSTVRITLDRYSHVTPTMQRAAADRIDLLFRALA